jgi:CRP-like cAMP-binding protein
MYKAMMMKEISSHDPEHRILTFIDYIKKERQSDDKPFTVNLTRQQMADLLGIRVETIIRSVKNLAEKGELSIVARKIIR